MFMDLRFGGSGPLSGLEGASLIRDKFEENSHSDSLLPSIGALPGPSRLRRSTQERCPPLSQSHSPAA